MIQYDYLKLFITNCKNDYKFYSRRYMTFCNKTMVSFFYMLTNQIELDDRVFFTAVELLNKYLMFSMLKTYNSIDKNQHSLNTQYESIKKKYLRDKYILAIACFRLATQICDQSIDIPRLIEYFHGLTRMHSNLMTTTRLDREEIIQMEIHILTTINHRFPQYTPYTFISYFLRFLNNEVKGIGERLHNVSMLLLVHIYLQWTSLIQILAKKESGSSKVNKIQMESVYQRFRDPLLLGSATILAASKVFCHGTNLQIHDKIISVFVNLLGIDPMRIYMAQFLAEEVIQKSNNIRLLIGPVNNASTRIAVEQEQEFDK